MFHPHAHTENPAPSPDVCEVGNIRRFPGAAPGGGANCRECEMRNPDTTIASPGEFTAGVDVINLRRRESMLVTRTNRADKPGTVHLIRFAAIR